MQKHKLTNDNNYLELPQVLGRFSFYFFSINMTAVTVKRKRGSQLGRKNLREIGMVNSVTERGLEEHFASHFPQLAVGVQSRIGKFPDFLFPNRELP